MKTRLLFFYALLCLTLSVSAQRSPENIFRTYQNDQGVMYLDMGGDFAKFLDKGQGISSKIESVKVMVFAKGQNMKENDLSDLKKALRSAPYEMLIQAKNEEGKANLYVIDDGEYFKELFGIIQSEEYNIYARVFGEIYYEELSKLDMNLGGKGNFGDLFGQ